MAVRLKEISLSGYKTIEKLEHFQPRSLNVLIGVNAAGKSNFIGFFRLLQWMLTPPGQLQLFIRDNGGAGAFLHYGSEKTQQITAHLALETDTGLNEYAFRLFHVAGDTLAFAEEKYRYSNRSCAGPAQWISLPTGALEAGLNHQAEAGDRTARIISGLIRRCVVFQFHNTSRSSRIKQRWAIDDNYHLKEDGANLGAFLYRLRHAEAAHYQRIVETVRLVFPLFADFELNPAGDTVLLQWRERGSDIVFPSYQASDGTLRFFALAALLLQPETTMPDVLLIDEPELGLHPHALEVLGGLLKKASASAQVIVSTQSASLLDQCDVEDVVVVSRREGRTELRRLTQSEMAAWLEEYTLGELWRKNYVEGASNG